MTDAHATDGRSYIDVWPIVEHVEGWMTYEQGRALYEAARACRPGGRIVEIGSFRGRSTIVLAAGAPAGVEVIAIDPHAGNDRGPQEIDGYAAEADADHGVFVANLERAGVADRVRHVRLSSHEAVARVDGPVDVLYIDGAHRYAAARADIREWGARVAGGGVLLIHDAFSSIGVTAAIARELLLSDRYRYDRRTRSLAVYRADLLARWPSRGRNAVRQLAELPWFARNVALKVALTLGLGKVLALIGRKPPEWPY